MAGAKVYRFGTVFSRVSSLIKTGVVKEVDKPVWFDVMAAFPPRITPKYDRFLDDSPIPDILYEEDNIRAKYYDTFGHSEVMDLSKIGEKYSCQKFLDHIKTLKSKNPHLDDDQAFEVAVNELQLKRPEVKTKTIKLPINQ